MRRRLRPLRARSTIARLCAWAACAALSRGSLAADLYYLGAQYTPGPGYPAPWPTDGSWFDTNLWQNGTLPTSTTNAIFGSDQTLPNGNTTHAPHILHFGNFGYFGTTTISGGTATAGTITILSDAWTFDLKSGQNPDFTGTLTPSTGSLTVFTLALAPTAGQSASLTISNSTLTATSLSVAGDSGCGLVTLTSNSYLTTTTADIGKFGPGTITQSGGTYQILDTLCLGKNPAATGVYTLTGGRLTVGKYEYLGYYGSAQFSQTGGTHTITGPLSLGFLGGSSAVYDMSGGVLTSNGGTIGGAGNSSFTQTGGTYSVSGKFYLGWGTGGNGVYSLSNSSLSASEEYIGYSGMGTVAQTGGTNTSSGLYLGWNASAAGSYVLNSGLVATGLEYVGSFGNGIFVQAGGTHTATSVMLGLSGSAAGTYSLNDGLFQSTQDTIGDYGSGTFTQTGGTHVTGGIRIGSLGLMNVSGGTLRIDGGLATSGTIAVGGTVTLALGGLVDLAQAQIQNPGDLSISLAANSLLILPADCTPDRMASFTNNGGIVVYAGNPVTIPANTLVATTFGSIRGTLICNGTLTGRANLYGGIQLQDTTANASLYAVNIDNANSLSGGRLYVVTSENVGLTGAGLFTQDGGTHTVSGTLYLGASTGCAGSYRLNNGLLTGYSDFVGYADAGSFSQSGGTHTLSGTLYVGYCLGRESSYALTAGQLTTAHVYVGASGMIQQTGGTHTVLGTLTLNGASGSAGRYVLSGGQLLVASEVINSGANGEFSQSGGTHTVSGFLRLGYYSSTSGIYNLSEGTLASNAVQVGFEGNGTFTQTGGTHSLSSSLALGYGPDITGIYNLSAGQLSTPTDVVGYSGQGTFTQTGGTHTTAGTLTLGYDSGAVGTYALNDGVLSVSSEIIGLSGTGSFIQTGGNHTVSGSLSLGALGLLRLTGGTLSLGGTLSNAGSLVLGGITTLSAGGIVDLSRATLLDVSQTTLNLSSGSVLCLPTGTYQFGAINNPGITFQDKGAMNIPAGSIVALGGWNFNAAVACAGTLTSSGTLTGAIQVTGSAGNVTLGTLVADTLSSTISNGQLRSTTEHLGYAGTGSFTQNGGTHTVAGALNLGYASGALGRYALSKGLLSTSLVAVGLAGTGSFTQTGGTHTVGNLSIARGSTYSLTGGTLQLTGGLSNLGALVLGGNGVLTAGGLVDLGNATPYSLASVKLTLAPNSLLILPSGNSPSQFASYSNVGGVVGNTGSTLTIPSGTQVAARDGSCRELILCAGTLTGNATLYNGIQVQGATASATLNTLRVELPNSGMTGGQLTLDTEYVGYAGSGLFTQTGGTHIVSGRGLLYVGYSGDAHGTIQMQGGTLSPYLLSVGALNNAAGTVLQTGGLLQQLNFYYEWRMGGVTPDGAGAVGVYSLSGGILNVVPNFQVGVYGNGTFTQTGGTATFNGWTSIGRCAGGVGHMTVSAGTLTHGGGSSTHLIVGEQGTGDLTISGTGLVQLATTLYMNYSTLTSGTVYLNGGTLICPGVSVIATTGPKAYFNFNGGTLKANASSTTFLQGLTSTTIQSGGARIDTNGYSITIAQPLIEDPAFRGGSLVKLGTGTLTLTGTGSHFDGLQVAAGILSVQSALTINTTSASRGTPAIVLDIAPGGLTFGTSGSVDITNHDVLLRCSPGTGASALSVTRNWLQTSKLKSTSLTTNQALACINNAALAAPFTSFDGITLADSNQILIKYTWKGDANLDGQINFNDYLALDAGYLFGGSDWTHGDFTGDSQVTFADYVAIDAAVLAQNQVLASDMIALHTQQFGESYTEALTAAVPEPASLALLALGSISMLQRRRRLPRRSSITISRRCKA